MSQGVIPLSAGGGGASVRSKINDALQRLQTHASGTARPSDVAAGEFWIETDNPGGGVWSLWLYDGTNDILLGTINSTTHAITWANSIAASLLTTQGDTLYRDGSGPARLAAGADAFKALFTGGAAANPAWVGSWKVLGELNPAAASTAQFTGIPAAVHHLMILGELSPGTDGASIYARTAGADGNFDSGAGDYQSINHAFATNNTDNATASGASSVLTLTPSGVDNGSAWYMGFTMFLPNIQRASYTKANWIGQYLYTDATLGIGIHGAGMRSEADRITGMEFFASTGTITGKLVALGLSN